MSDRADLYPPETKNGAAWRKDGGQEQFVVTALFLNSEIDIAWYSSFILLEQCFDG